jgi:hypothetical protein
MMTSLQNSDNDKVSIGAIDEIAQYLKAIDPIVRLKRLSMHHLFLDEGTVLALLANSRDTLTTFHLHSMVLVDHGSWKDLLSIIGRKYPRLTEFRLLVLKEENYPSRTVDFVGINKDQLPELCRPGLDMPLRGTPENRRITRIAYQGSDAGSLLAELARYASYVP